MPKRTPILLIALVLLIAYWLRVNHLYEYPPGISHDEAQNPIEAAHITQSWRWTFYEDPFRPEPLFRVVTGLTALFLGKTVFVFRYTYALLGVLAVAVTFWAMKQCIPESNSRLRWLPACAALGALAVAIGHITVTRSVYRASLEPLAIAFFVGFLMRGLRAGRRRDFVLAGIALAAVVHSYLAGPIVVFVLIPVGLSLLIFQRSTWRVWLPNLALLAVVTVVLISPLLVKLATDPRAVLGYPGDIQNAARHALTENLLAMVRQFVVVGDGTPLYNTDSQPLIPALFVVWFLLGLAALVIWVRRPASALMAGLLILTPIPMLLVGEVPQNLRIVGVFAVFPLVIGLGVALMLQAADRWRWAAPGVTLVVIGMIAASAVTSYRIYNGYWSKPYVWHIFGEDIPHGEWFFRTDQRDFGRWVSQQSQPMLIPAEYLDRTFTRVWLLNSFPRANGVDHLVQLPPNTLLVVPWRLEQGDLMRNARQYALLYDHTITLLPPFSDQTHEALLRGIDSAEPVYREGHLRLMAHIKPVPADFHIAFEPMTVLDDPIIFDDGLVLIGWNGPLTIAHSDVPQMAEYTLYFKQTRPLWRNYAAFAELHTASFDRKAWDHQDLWHWLLPSTIWTNGDIVSREFRLALPADLDPGAYRLVVGAEITFLRQVEDRLMDARTQNGTLLSNPVTLTWIKVPQEPVLVVPSTQIDATLAGAVALKGAEAYREENGQVSIILTWQSLIERPDFDATIFVHVLDQEGNIIAQNDQRPWNGQYPTFIWGEGEVVQTRHLLDLGGADPADLQVVVGMYTLPDAVRLAAMQEGQPATDNLIQLGRLSDLLVEP